MHGSVYQSGFPDLYCTHIKYGARLVEVKLPGMKGSKFTPAQLEWFPILHGNGSPIWVLVAANEAEYKKLFQPANLLEYMLHAL